MLTTLSLIEQLRAQYGGVTNYRIARILQVSDVTIIGYTVHNKIMSAAIGLKMAHQLALNAEYVVMCLAVERERNPDVKAVLTRVAKRAAALKPPKRKSIPLLPPPARIGRPPYQARLFIPAATPAPRRAP